jgi:hypothetical protein
MKAVTVAIAAVAMASASAAVAENLINYAEDADGRLYYYDSDTIRTVSGGYITVWTVQDGSRDRTVRWRTRRVLYQIDCDDMRSSSVSFADYDANGRLLESDSWYPKMTPDVPGSVGFSLTEAVCAR